MKCKIMVVEDDPAISDILAIMLKRNGYDVVEYATGESLLNEDLEWPDLFLLDKQLTDMDGIELCKHLKNQPATQHIPLIILSATPGLHEIVRKAGADAFIEKPFTSRALLNTIYNLLQRERSSNY